MIWKICVCNVVKSYTFRCICLLTFNPTYHATSRRIIQEHPQQILLICFHGFPSYCSQLCPFKTHLLADELIKLTIFIYTHHFYITQWSRVYLHIYICWFIRVSLTMCSTKQSDPTSWIELCMAMVWSSDHITSHIQPPLRLPGAFAEPGTATEPPEPGTARDVVASDFPSGWPRRGEVNATQAGGGL